MPLNDRGISDYNLNSKKALGKKIEASERELD
jgi:hypothetical protein